MFWCNISARAWSSYSNLLIAIAKYYQFCLIANLLDWSTVRKLFADGWYGSLICMSSTCGMQIQCHESKIGSGVDGKGYTGLMFAFRSSPTTSTPRLYLNQTLALFNLHIALFYCIWCSWESTSRPVTPVSLPQRLDINSEHHTRQVSEPIKICFQATDNPFLLPS
jgi:hypothetical protein